MCIALHLLDISVIVSQMLVLGSVYSIVDKSEGFPCLAPRTRWLVLCQRER